VKGLEDSGSGGTGEDCLEGQDVLILDWHSKQHLCPAQVVKTLRHLARFNYRSFR
jgi:hypothetical protein